MWGWGVDNRKGPHFRQKGQSVIANMWREIRTGAGRAQRSGETDRESLTYIRLRSLDHIL